jgi:hypothetical protein
MERSIMATKKQKAQRAIKDLGLLMLDHALRGELASDLARLFATTKAARDEDEVFKAQLKKGHREWKDTSSSPAQ